MPNKSNNSNRRKNNELHGNERLHIISECYDNCIRSIAEASRRLRNVSGELSPCTVFQGVNGPNLAHSCVNLQILENMLQIFTYPSPSQPGPEALCADC